MKNELYLECAGGISGDMFTAALIDLGADRTAVEKALASLNTPGFSIEFSRVKKSGLDVCDFAVHLDEEHENHDHDTAYLYGSSTEGHEHEHTCSDEDSHIHSHSHEAEEHHDDEDHGHEHSHHHEHRTLNDILAILDSAAMTDSAKALAVKIFTILAEAEAEAHGVSTDEVHFHEVGAVDSIADITAAAVCFDSLGITDTVVSPLCEGTGTVRCQHGILCVPVPAVTNIVKKYRLPLHITERSGEYVTPTGAAIAAALRTKDRLPSSFTIVKTGLGAGKREQDGPGFLRAMLIQGTETQNGTVCKLETNIDDCTPQALGYCMDRLMQAGARDVHYIPVFMKKDRPAYLLETVCSEEDRTRLENIIFETTTTIGIRRVTMERTVLDRTEKTVRTKFGDISVKAVTLPDGTVRSYPEYSTVVQLCENMHLNYQDAYRAALKAAAESDDAAAVTGSSRQEKAE